MSANTDDPKTEAKGFPDFILDNAGPVSHAFIKHGLLSFGQAAYFIRHLPYGRNADKDNLLTVFADRCGTCSTKHALLKQLADEQNFTGLQLILGLFTMTAQNTPEVAQTLAKHRLTGIPEAHTYLKYKGQRFDLMKAGANASDFVNDLIEETEISPAQITGFKVAYHQAYLKQWLAKHPQLPLTFDALWLVREQCIKDLGN